MDEEALSLVELLRARCADVRGPGPAPVSSDDPRARRLLRALERALCHGLRPRSLWSARCALWDVLVRLPDCLPRGSDRVDRARRAAATPAGRARVLLRVALNEGDAGDCVAALVGCAGLAQRFYEPWAAVACRGAEVAAALEELQASGAAFALEPAPEGVDRDDYWDLQPRDPEFQALALCSAASEPRRLRSAALSSALAQALVRARPCVPASAAAAACSQASALLRSSAASRSLQAALRASGECGALLRRSQLTACACRLRRSARLCQPLLACCSAAAGFRLLAGAACGAQGLCRALLCARSLASAAAQSLLRCRGASAAHAAAVGACRAAQACERSAEPRGAFVRGCAAAAQAQAAMRCARWAPGALVGSRGETPAGSSSGGELELIPMAPTPPPLELPRQEPWRLIPEYATAGPGAAPRSQAPRLRPHWVSDKTSSICPCCRQAFTITRRKHHCRSCGNLVCKGCSEKIELPNLRYAAPVRVCDPCRQMFYT
eukprot:m51a1_g7831 hypothetical protein (496) ;mRNA; f:164343-166232